MGDKYLVTAPVTVFTGTLAGLVFHDGTATADSDMHARALAYCRRAGYGVEPVGITASDADQHERADSARPKTTDPKPDWVAYAVTQGADEDVAEAMTKANLVAKYGTKGSSDE